jgi:predicted dienelactone hydrolase
MPKRILAALLSLGLMLGCAPMARAESPGDAAFKVGTASRRFVPPEPYDWRGTATHVLITSIWYPADANVDERPQRIGPPFGPAIFDAGKAAADAAVASSPGKYPLILLSHGTGGTAQAVAWFGIALAAHGYIVAAVNHPGNNGLEPYTAQGFALWWERARDISAVLDAMLADTAFGPRIDQGRIGAAGHSLGGYTMVELAGGISSYPQLESFCRPSPDQASCKPPPEFAELRVKAEALASTNAAFAAALRGSGASYREPRIRAVFAMAPALAPAFAPDSLKAIAIPVAIVAGESDSIVPIDVNAKYYAATIPHAALTILPGGAGHYVFIDDCTAVGRITAAAICVDRPGVDRDAIHRATTALALKFFDAQLR